jgi:hypothetical protein
MPGGPTQLLDTSKNFEPAIGDTAMNAWGWRREAPVAPGRRRLKSWMCVESPSDLSKKLTWT